MNRVQTTRPLAIFVSEDWRSQYLPSNTAAQEEVPSVSPPSDTPVIEQQTPEILEEPQEEGPDLQLAVVLDNQQRLMMAIDQMASGFSSQLQILARRIDNFERILEQSQGQPTMTNLMFDAPEVFEKVLAREEEDDVEEDSSELLRADVMGNYTPAVQPPTPDSDFEIPDEVSHLLEFDPTFPVSIEAQVSFFMWKEKKASWNDFVKAAGGPKKAKEARELLE
ncbi:MAG: hypothetical protein CMG17_07505 [Candidatus Marinimicrobia bacterium]|nr:hypothetical protein [Candidatus Neomarinimicrobiota bacterium]MAR96276.1 hypothetical protein [Candidatus Neomarinimicrobiota bacterium]MAR97472.1 hypothetical protein [Candidatus Neomarinimicrobiota bacterium]